MAVRKGPDRHTAARSAEDADADPNGAVGDPVLLHRVEQAVLVARRVENEPFHEVVSAAGLGGGVVRSDGDEHVVVLLDLAIAQVVGAVAVRPGVDDDVRDPAQEAGGASRCHAGLAADRLDDLITRRLDADALGRDVRGC